MTVYEIFTTNDEKTHTIRIEHNKLVVQTNIASVKPFHAFINLRVSVIIIVFCSNSKLSCSHRIMTLI